MAWAKHFTRRLLVSDGSWGNFESNWNEQCSQNNDDLESYGIMWFDILKKFASEDSKSARVYSIEIDGSPHAVYFANWTKIKGHKKEILRIRHLVVSPDIDYGNLKDSDYARVLQSTFSSVLQLSHNELPADHVRIHLKSPSDIPVFSSLGALIAEDGVIAESRTRGSWIFMDKRGN